MLENLPMTTKTHVPSDPARDERLADLLAALTAEAQRGGQPDIDRVAAAHPDLADELRELWAAVQFANEFTRPSKTQPTLPANGPIRVDPAPPPASPLPRAFGGFDLLEELGRGGMGFVYKAWDRSLKRMVALKMILRGELAMPADLARFQVEAAAAAHLSHPNIVPLFAVGCEASVHYYAMQFIDGQTLGTLMSRGPLRPRDAARYLAVVARAVHYAHERGVLHRDLKPSNVLVDASGQPHVTDFGLAKRIATATNVPSESETGLTLSGAILGTPTYMAPEQVSNRRGKPSPASDVYSLGVILYEMLTGRPPFQGATPVDTLLLVLDQDPVRPRLLNPKVDPDLELICLKCIQKDPALRYASAAKLAGDLEAYLKDEDLSVRTFSLRTVANLFSRAFRETHHAPVLENWGLLWMVHSVKILVLCFLTAWMSWSGVENPLWYLLLWGGGLCAWGAIFWHLRKRGGPVLFVERQVAHVWAAAVVATIGVFVVETLLHLHYPDMKVLTLSPILAVIAGMVFVVKAGMLSGEFYISAAALFLTVIPMALLPEYGPIIFGVVTAIAFFVPGLKYHLQRLRSLKTQANEIAAP
jgi:serine/threonine-protein kinase